MVKSFDRNVDYVKIREEFLETIYNIINYEKIEKYIRIVYLVICLIQLRNGSRISEAIKCFRLLKNDNITNKLKVPLSKRKKDNVKRSFILPKFLDVNIVELSLIIADTKIFNDDIHNVGSRIRKYLLTYHNRINTHSLRYAYVNYLLSDKNLNINNVAKIIGHTTVKHIVRYTQNKKAEEILDEYGDD